jgi:predicted MPP superfamily phosphohydrolase
VINSPFAKEINIALLSDIHDNVSDEILQVLDLAKPDIVAVTGDLVSRTTTDFSDVIRLVEEISSKYFTVISLGNHELDLPKNAQKEFFDKIRLTNANLLDNESLEYGEIVFYGASLKRTIYKKNNSYRNLDKLFLTDLPKKVKNSKYNILLAHNPLFFETYVEWGADLVLSGHMHGGFVKMPFFGGVLSPERKLFPKFDKGIYHRQGSTLAISAGLNKLRFNIRREILLVKLHKNID